MMNNKKYILGGIILAVVVSGLTYVLAPTKVQIKEVEKIVEVKGETETIYKEKIKIVITKPDGTTIKKEIEKDLNKKEKEETFKKETEKEKLITRDKYQWGIGGGIIVNTEQNFYITVEKRLVGNFFVNGIAATNNTYGVGIGFKF